MTEEIIIDGVDVAGCCKCYNVEQKILCGASGICANNPNCYYKQLKRLEQENKKLKEEIQILNKDSYTRLREMSVLDTELDEVGVINNKYRSTLEEIKHIIVIRKDEFDHCLYHNYHEQILIKINEVLQ